MIFTPLGVQDLDIWRNPSMDERRVQMAFNVGPGEFIPLPTPFDTAQFEHEPPVGMTPCTFILPLYLVITPSIPLLSLRYYLPSRLVSYRKQELDAHFFFSLF